MPANVHFRLDVDGERQFSRRLHGLVGVVSSWQPFFERFAERWKTMVRERFEREGAIDGEARWPELSERYARWKAKHFPGKPILQRTGALLAALTSPVEEISDQRLVITVDSPYAIFHHSAEPRRGPLPRRVIASRGSHS